MEDETYTECSICGKNGLPHSECKICHGNAQVQKRAFTLSEERSGRVPEDQREKRYTETGGLRPKIIHLPGSGGPEDPPLESGY